MRLDFPQSFQALTGHAPLKWQERLFGRLVDGDAPPLVRLSTGLGKTSIIPIWLIALADSALANNTRPPLPRRLVYIVNRRTVVDQATDDAKRLLGCVYKSGRRDSLTWATDEAIAALGLKAESPLRDDEIRTVVALSNALASLSGDDAAAPLAVSTLRGELADNGEWKINPARPAIIIGTIDMIGSKLLFSGYGDGRYGRVHHAGLLGQDTLIVHDEAHLSPAFSRLLWEVEREQRIGEKYRDDWGRSICVMELSATTRADAESERLRGEAWVQRGGADPSKAVFPTPEEAPELFADPGVRHRREATKRLSLTDFDGGKKDDAFAAKLADEAHKYDAAKCRVLIYVQSPVTAGLVVKEIKAKLRRQNAGQSDIDHRIRLLAGTIRGYERDRMAESDLFKTFKADPNRAALEQTLYLVSTSAGEVGADLDADHLVCDLTTLESMAQRFGRVNRLGVDANGEKRTARIAVVVEKPRESRKAAQPAESTPAGAEGGKKNKKQSPLDAAIARTGEILRRIADNGGEVSPAALAQVIDGLSSVDMRAAFSPMPTVRPTTDILFDAWSLTSIAGELPGRPEVGPYLHGVAEWEPPDTYVAWRAELAGLARANVSNDDLEEVFDVFPIQAAERLRDRTDRVFDELRKLADRLDPDHARADADAEAPRPGSDRDPRVVLIKQNKVRWIRLSELAPADKSRETTAISRLEHAIVVLPVEAGGLKSDGTFDGNAPPPAAPTALDVAEATVSDPRVRRRIWINADNTETPLTADGFNGALPCKLRIALADDEDAEDEVDGRSRKVAIEYRVERTESGEPGTAVTLQEHASAVVAAADGVGQALALDDSIREALALAARLHDTGKARAVWQRYARNGGTSAAPLAKAPRYLHPKALGGYRHEFGSLHEAASDPKIANHVERDLILHLIVAHHGWGRPHFETGAFDRERLTSENKTAVVEAMQRFGRLQQRFGRWGLAWLESLFRCADALGSRSEPNRERVGVGPAGSSYTATSENRVGGSA